MSTSSTQSGDDPELKARLRAVLTQYQRSSTGRALWQIFNTIVPYVLLWVLMYYIKQISLWAALPLAVLAGLLLVRVFIFFHDCGHGSFFKSPWANSLVGFIAGVLTFTPYYHWRWQHGIHHGTSGHLDKRGVGDVWTLTVQEYLDSSRWKRFSYRFIRSPFVLFVIAPLYVFLFRQRFASSTASPRERQSVCWMNFALLGVTLFNDWAPSSTSTPSSHRSWPWWPSSSCGTPRSPKVFRRSRSTGTTIPRTTAPTMSAR